MDWRFGLLFLQIQYDRAVCLSIASASQSFGKFWVDAAARLTTHAPDTASTCA